MSDQISRNPQAALANGEYQQNAPSALVPNEINAGVRIAFISTRPHEVWGLCLINVLLCCTIYNQLMFG